MTTWTLTDDVVTIQNSPVGAAGYYGDLAPGDIASGDIIIGGNDTVTAAGYIAGDLGQGSSLGFASGVTVVGGNDVLTGSTGYDIINGGGGNDTMDGGAGFDFAEYLEPYIATPADARVVLDLELGRSWSDYYGNDMLANIEGVIGSIGNDWIGGSAAGNELAGAYGDDVIYGFGGNDRIEGNQGNDALYGGDGDDLIGDVLSASGQSVGTSGNNWMSGGNGNDTILAHGAKVGEWSALHGDAGNDTLSGSGTGSLGLYGGDGNDSIEFGAGTVYAEGGAGADVFGPSRLAFTDPASFAQVFDFEDGLDKISLAAISGATTANVNIRDWGANTGILINDGAGHSTTLMLMGVTSDKITADGDFLLV